MLIPQNIPWKMVGLGIAVIAALAAIWFLVVSPRLELAREREEQAVLEKRRAEVVAAANEVLAKAAAEVAADRAAIVDEVTTREAPIIQRERIIRQQIIEQARVDGDPMVSPGMDAFLREMGK